VRHTAADAFFRGYKIVVPENGVDSFTEEDHKSGLAYLKEYYAATIATAETVIKELR
jgi:nicotinamidase-related amidase